MARVSMVHVSYNGGVAALSGLATRQVSLVFAAQPLALAFIPSEFYRPLAVTSARRSERLADLPTLAESGLADFEVEGGTACSRPREIHGSRAHGCATHRLGNGRAGDTGGTRGAGP